MSIREEMIFYAKRCVNGETLSGQKHIWACQRLLRDFERLEQGKFYWDEESAESIVGWFKLLRHSKGDYWKIIRCLPAFTCPISCFLVRQAFRLQYTCSK